MNILVLNNGKVKHIAIGSRNTVANVTALSMSIDGISVEQIRVINLLSRSDQIDHIGNNLHMILPLLHLTLFSHLLVFSLFTTICQKSVCIM